MSDTTIDVQVIEPDGDVGQMIEDHLSRAIHLRLERACVNICRAGSADQAMDQFLARPADVVITELELPESDGVSMLAEMRGLAVNRSRLVTLANCQRASCQEYSNSAEPFIGLPSVK